MKKTKTMTANDHLARICAMPAEQFEAKAEELLREATAALFTLQALREARKEQG